MKTNSHGIMIPEPANSTSPDKFSEIVAAVISNANLMESWFTINGNMSAVQSDSAKGWMQLINGAIIQTGHPTTIKMKTSGKSVIGKIVFEKPFPHACTQVTGSDDGGSGMSFGFYNKTKTGCTWCTCDDLGIAGRTYSPSFTAIGW